MKNAYKIINNLTTFIATDHCIFIIIMGYSVYAVSRVPAGEQTSDGVGQVLRLAIEF